MSLGRLIPAHCHDSACVSLSTGAGPFRERSWHMPSSLVKSPYHFLPLWRWRLNGRVLDPGSGRVKGSPGSAFNYQLSADYLFVSVDGREDGPGKESKDKSLSLVRPVVPRPNRKHISQKELTPPHFHSTPRQGLLMLPLLDSMTLRLGHLISPFWYARTVFKWILIEFIEAHQ